MSAIPSSYFQCRPKPEPEEEPVTTEQFIAGAFLLIMALADRGDDKAAE